MKNNLKKIFKVMNGGEVIFLVIKVLLVLVFLVSLAVSLRFVYKIINETLTVKPTVSQKPFFDIERFKKIAPEWGIIIEEPHP
jgi:hypothetical protein